MSEILSLDSLGIKPEGATLTLSLAPGQSLGICGPAGSGKTKLLSTIGGREKPVQGTVRIQGDLLFPPELPRRTRVQNFVRQYSDFAEILHQAGLFESRLQWMGDLTPSQQNVAILCPALSSTKGIVVLDGLLDPIDPWLLPSILECLRRQRRQGVACVATSNRPDILAQFDLIVALRRQEVRFAGTIEDLLRTLQRHELRVESHKQAGVLALVEPFEASIEESSEGLRIWAKEGQELAAKLMLQGYGNVRTIVHRAPTIEDALRAIV